MERTSSRPVWSGSITFGLVNIPVKLFTAVREKTLHFRSLHDEDKVPLKQKLVCPAHNKEVHAEHIVKGFEIGKDRYVVVRQDELEAAAPKTSKAIEIVDFVPLDQIDPVFFDRPYYVAPQSEGAKAYTLLMQAMVKKDKVGIAKVVMHNKEYLTALRPIDGTLCLETMHFGDEVVSADSISALHVKSNVDPRELKIAEQLIDSLAGDFEPKKYHDEYREQVMELVEKKAKGEEVVTTPPEEKAPARSTNLMAALEASLAKAKATQPADQRAKEKDGMKAKSAAGKAKRTKTGTVKKRTGASPSRASTARAATGASVSPVSRRPSSSRTVASHSSASHAASAKSAANAELVDGVLTGDLPNPLQVGSRSVSLSNLTKPLYPNGFTKGKVIDYYRHIARIMLPHLRGRAVTLKRYPNGSQAPFFYEKHCPTHRPDWVKTADIISTRSNETVDYCLIDEAASLVWIANLASLEVHVSLAKATKPAMPTMMVFDLDPGAPATIVDCGRVALHMRDALGKMKLESLVKTSGSKGLHLYVPLNTATTFDKTKAFAHSLALALEKADPSHVTATMSKSVRGGKIFVDWSQNDQHKTTVCVYSLRAREQPTVSTPITWDELAAAVDAHDAARLSFLPDAVLRRCLEHGDLFEPLHILKQRLPPREPRNGVGT